METIHSLGFFFGSVSKMTSLDQIYVLLAKTSEYWKGIGTTASAKYPFLYKEDLFLIEIESLMKKSGYKYHHIQRLIKSKTFSQKNIYERTLIFAWLRKTGYLPVDYNEIHKNKAEIERRVFWVTAVETPEGKTIKDINMFRRYPKISSPDERIECIMTFPVKEALDRLFQSFYPTAPTYVGLKKGLTRLLGPLKKEILEDLRHYTSSLESS